MFKSLTVAVVSSLILICIATILAVPVIYLLVVFTPITAVTALLGSILIVVLAHLIGEVNKW